MRVCDSARPSPRTWWRCGSARTCAWPLSLRPPISPPASPLERRKTWRQHNCINLRFPTRGGLYAWEFEKAGRALNVRVEGQLVVNEIALALQATVGGLGIAYLPEDYVRADIEAGRLTRVLDPGARHSPVIISITPAAVINRRPSRLLVEALRYRT